MALLHFTSKQLLLIIMKITKLSNIADRFKTLALQVGLIALGHLPVSLGIIDGKNIKKTLQSFVSASTLDLEPRVATFPKYARLAYSYIGQKEVPGSKSNPLILRWIQDFLGWGDDDSKVAWCAIFINTILKESDIKGTGKANARSFLNWGEVVETPRRGDIVVFERGGRSSWKGHVGLYWGEAEDGFIYCLGGNQSDKVSIASYSKSRILGYRRP